jgi:hemolysin III
MTMTAPHHEAAGEGGSLPPGAGAAAAAVAPPPKPRLRGVLHQWGFVASLPAGLLLLALAPDGRARLALTVYAIGLSGLLGTSALYHRVMWQPVARRWLRRLDHSMIFLLVAGTVTPFAVLVMHGALATVLLVVVWAGAIGGITLSLLWPDAPKPLTAAMYIALGWAGAATTPQLLDRAGPGAVALIAIGGILYTLGAIAYARGRPNPWPHVFGYHEVFHALVVAAAMCHYTAVLIYAR